jgi:hypothetical protein
MQQTGDNLQKVEPGGEGKITNIGKQILGTQNQIESKSHFYLRRGLASDERGAVTNAWTAGRVQIPSPRWSPVQQVPGPLLIKKLKLRGFVKTIQAGKRALICKIFGTGWFRSSPHIGHPKAHVSVSKFP